MRSATILQFSSHSFLLRPINWIGFLGMFTWVWPCCRRTMAHCFCPGITKALLKQIYTLLEAQYETINHLFWINNLKINLKIVYQSMTSPAPWRHGPAVCKQQPVFYYAFNVKGLKRCRQAGADWKRFAGLQNRVLFNY